MLTTKNQKKWQRHHHPMQQQQSPSRSTPVKSAAMRGGSRTPSPIKSSHDSPMIASLPQHTQFKFPTLNKQIPSDQEQYPEVTPEKPDAQSSFWNSPSLLAPMFNLFAAAASASSPTSSEEDVDDEEDKEAEDDVESVLLDELQPYHEEDEDMEEQQDEDDECTVSQQVSAAPVAAAAVNEFDPILFIALLPCHSTAMRTNMHVLRPHLPQLMPARPTLVLDLDETLVHCNSASEGQPGTFDIAFEVKFNNAGCNVYVRKRPHLDLFLKHVAAKFEVIIFTASQRVYAERLLDLLDPTGELIHHRLFRESCVTVSGNLVKDLTVLGRDLSRTMIVDNCPHAFGYHVDNGIPILSWYEDNKDVELLKLMSLLDDLHQVQDVRPVINQTFGLRAMVEEVKNQMLY